MPTQDAIDAEYTICRDTLSGAPWPRSPPDDADRSMTLAFVLYGLINLAAAALGLLIWIV